MRIAFHQLNPAFGEKSKNVARVEAAVARLKADILVLPELFTTGYQFASDAEVRSLAEPFPDGESLLRLAALARASNMAVAAGFLERDGDGIYNSAVLAMPGEGAATGAPAPVVARADGVTLGLYRKVHLFNTEKRWMKPGNLGFPLFHWRGAAIGLLVCFDWIFPEATRALALQGMEILLHPSNLVLPYCQEAMRTRAIENGIFAVTVNRVGTEERTGPEDRLTFTGMSQVVNPKGEVLARAGRDEELRVVEVDFAAARAKQITPRNHILGDRRPDCYGALTAPQAPQAAREIR